VGAGGGVKGDWVSMGACRGGGGGLLARM
jgi:hypothetical protein